jgi:predicted dehydrogenase
MTIEHSANSPLSRRDFVKLAAGAATTAATMGPANLFAAGSDRVRVGLIGCGGRGTYDTTHLLKAADGVEVTAAGDLFEKQAVTCLGKLREQFPDRIKATPETTFTGFDAYEKVVATDCDLVILTTPPNFRPPHFRAAVEAGKHVFMEKPVAVDPVGVRSVIETGELADRKRLVVGAGTQARCMNHRIELVERIRDGQIGRIISGQCLRRGGGMLDWHKQERKPAMSDMEWAIRRWLFNTWLSGDFIAEMHVHELDITNWLLGSTPVKCMLVGGRQVRTDTHLYGDCYDHFSGQYEYPDGIIVTYIGTQIDGGTNATFERIQGTRGVAYTDWSGSNIEGRRPWKYEQKDNDPIITQFRKLVNAIRGGKRHNEARRIAESSLTAIFGRMSAYTGRELKFQWAMKASKLDLMPEKMEMGPLPPIEIPTPGKTELV